MCWTRNVELIWAFDVLGWPEMNLLNSEAYILYKDFVRTAQ